MPKTGNKTKTLWTNPTGVTNVALKRLEKSALSKTLAEAIGVSAQTYKAMETAGTEQRVRKTTQMALANYYECPVEELFSADGQPLYKSWDEVSVGTRLLRERAKQGASISEFSKKLGVNRMTLAAIEHGRAKASSNMQVKIAEGLGLTVDALFGPDGSAI